MGLPKPEELISTVNLKKMPSKWWMDLRTEFKPGFYCHGAKGKNLAYVDFPNARDFHVTDEDWKLPEDWKKTVIEGIRQRLERFRTFHVFMDICVRCGACADNATSSSEQVILKTCLF